MAKHSTNHGTHEQSPAGAVCVSGSGGQGNQLRAHKQARGDSSLLASLRKSKAVPGLAIFTSTRRLRSATELRARTSVVAPRHPLREASGEEGSLPVWSGGARRAARGAHAGRARQPSEVNASCDMCRLVLQKGGGEGREGAGWMGGDGTTNRWGWAARRDARTARAQHKPIPPLVLRAALC